MAHHEPCDPQEVFLGNHHRSRDDERIKSLADKGLKTLRRGRQAYDIEGKVLPSDYVPLFLNRSEEPRYDAIMMERAFGPNWRRA